MACYDRRHLLDVACTWFFCTRFRLHAISPACERWRVWMCSCTVYMCWRLSTRDGGFPHALASFYMWLCFVAWVSMWWHLSTCASVFLHVLTCMSMCWRGWASFSMLWCAIAYFYTRWRVCIGDGGDNRLVCTRVLMFMHTSSNKVNKTAEKQKLTILCSKKHSMMNVRSG